MSFSGKVKEELVNVISHSRHCQIAELAALFLFLREPSQEGISLRTDNEAVLRKYFTLIKKTFNIDNALYKEEEKQILSAVYGPSLLQKSCCRRAYLRGAFLAVGSVSDPEKSYHLEMVCQSEERADEIRELLATFEIAAKQVVRKGHYVVYLKEGSQIVDTLNVIGAHVALMDFENSRILKDMRNSVNRRVNCETANIGKTVSAAVRQAGDIELVMQSELYEELPDSLKAIAQARLMNPNVSLKELGELLDPPIGKSGVNHRLRKLSEIAAALRDKQ
ncbi:MAG: DNA-binding protein WhiA [Lachnospiraceae bacterium]|nr:DNA-binding protein WhiA [Lachnospiraceae bacterium]MCR4684325.1 DNA-binding protein WhiA [Lachnospiraceae bacterium]